MTTPGRPSPNGPGSFWAVQLLDSGSLGLSSELPTSRPIQILPPSLVAPFRYRSDCWGLVYSMGNKMKTQNELRLEEALEIQKSLDSGRYSAARTNNWYHIHELRRMVLNDKSEQPVAQPLVEMQRL